MHLTIRFLKYVAILIFLKEVVALGYNQFCSQTLSFYIFPPSFSLLFSSLSLSLSLLFFFFFLLFEVSKVCVLYSIFSFSPKIIIRFCVLWCLHDSHIYYFFIILNWNLSVCDEKMYLIQNPNGDIIDCVHIKNQPAFDHPFFKNHTILVTSLIM